MKIDFSNPGHIKLSLLSKGVLLDKKTRFLIGKKYAENMYPYGNSNSGEVDLQTMPSEILLPNDVVVGVHLRSGTPWSISLKTDNSMTLSYNDKTITTVEFSPRPGFFDIKLKDGTLCQKTVVMYGLYSLSFFSRGWCYYNIINKPCKFCSMSQSRKNAGKSFIKAILPEIAKEAAEIAFKSEKRIKHVDYCAGAHKDNDLGIKLQLELLKLVKKVSPKQIKHHLLTIPPDDLELFYELKKAGLDTIILNLEVFNKKLFKEICPAKDLCYGYDKYFQALQRAKNIFGFKNVYTGFVAGLEPIDSLIKGIKFVAEKGFTPALNVFHADPGTELENYPIPDEDYLLKAVKVQGEMYKKYKFRPIFPGGTRSSLDSEVFRGFFY